MIQGLVPDMMNEQDRDMLKNDGKIFFLIVTTDLSKKMRIKAWVEELYPNSVVYTAGDYMECLIKIKNAPPNLLIIDYDLSKGRPGQMVDQVIGDSNDRIAVISMGSKIRNEKQHDAVTIGRLFFANQLETIVELKDAISKVEFYAFQTETNQYTVKSLKAGEILISEGDTTRQVYIVKKGRLKAYQQKPPGEVHVLGEVHAGEFVGEMAYFNEEARMATVEAIEDSELIEIQPQVFEKVIYQRPSWAKILFSTLAKRLKK